MVSGLKSVQEMRLPADADRPPPPAFPFTLQLVVLPSLPPLPASLKHSEIQGCCSQRSCWKYRGEKAERKDRNADPLGLSGAEGGGVL